MSFRRKEMATIVYKCRHALNMAFFSCGQVAKWLRPKPQIREIEGSIPGRVIPKSKKSPFYWLAAISRDALH